MQFSVVLVFNVTQLVCMTCFLFLALLVCNNYKLTRMSKKNWEEGVKYVGMKYRVERKIFIIYC